MDISEEDFFFQYGNVEDVSPVISKECIANGDFVLQVTVTLKNHFDIRDTLIRRGRNIFVIVEGRNPYCWTCSATGHLSKDCHRWCLVPQHHRRKQSSLKRRTKSLIVTVNRGSKVAFSPPAGCPREEAAATTATAKTARNEAASTATT